MSTNLNVYQPPPPDAPIWLRQWYTVSMNLAATAQRVASSATADRPTGVAAGYMIFDSTLGQPIWWDGTQWVDATGAAA